MIKPSDRKNPAGDSAVSVQEIDTDQSFRKYRVTMTVEIDERDIEAIGVRVGDREMAVATAVQVVRGMVAGQILEARQSLRRDYESVNENH